MSTKIYTSFENALEDIYTEVATTFPEYEPKKLVRVFYYDQEEKIQEAVRFLLNQGFYAEKLGDTYINGKIILYPRCFNERIILQLKYHHITTSVKKYLRQNQETLELKLNYDIENILRNCEQHHLGQYMKFSSLLYRISNKSEKHPKFIANALFNNGNLVAGDIVVEFPDKGIITGFTGFYKQSNARKALIALFVKQKKEEGYFLLDMGPRSIKEEMDYYKFHMGAEVILDKDYYPIFKEGRSYGKA